MKLSKTDRRILACGSRSREGAWIEISIRPCGHKYSKVAPARERGLKLRMLSIKISVLLRRSREGAWIEMSIISGALSNSAGRSREGAWIEMLVLALVADAVASLPRGSVD